MTKHKNTSNIDSEEINHFETLANRWWDPDGPLRTLHNINPVRFEWINAHAPVTDKQVLDVGCGGGILSETMSQHGAQVTGIDAAEEAIKVASLHSESMDLDINYLPITAETLAAKQPESFDLITCLEMLEHVPDPKLSIQAIGELAKPGADVFFSTINRNLLSWLTAIVGGEYILGLIPKGTHQYEKLIKPSELAAFCRSAGLETKHLKGMLYNPFTHQCRLTSKVEVNYLLHCTKSSP